MAQNSSRNSHQGWNPEEQDLLYREVTHVREQELPLRMAFEAVAKETGRKPNSVRNYYYAAIKEGQIAIQHDKAAFMPFRQEEIEHLIETVLSAQANGQSVRSITLAMGNNERKAMLRYQNKYRSMVKHYPHVVLSIVERMQGEGKKTFNPYRQERPHKSGRKPHTRNHQDVEDTINQLAQALKRLKGIDANGFLRQLTTLADLASVAQEEESHIS